MTSYFNTNEGSHDNNHLSEVASSNVEASLNTIVVVTPIGTINNCYLFTTIDKFNKYMEPNCELKLDLCFFLTNKCSKCL